jgi:hypothetical protein
MQTDRLTRRIVRRSSWLGRARPHQRGSLAPASTGRHSMRPRVWSCFWTILATIAGVLGAVAADQQVADLTCYGPGVFSSAMGARRATPPFCVRLVGSPADTPDPGGDAYWPKDWRSMMPSHAKGPDRPLPDLDGMLQAVDLTLPPLPPELSNSPPK